jgi:hypothetical protein
MKFLERNFARFKGSQTTWLQWRRFYTFLYMFQLAPRTIINESCVEVVKLGRDVFLRLFAEFSDWYLEQWMYIKFFVKLGNNVSHTCAMLLEIY